MDENDIIFLLESNDIDEVGDSGIGDSRIDAMPQIISKLRSLEKENNSIKQIVQETLLSQSKTEKEFKIDVEERLRRLEEEFVYCYRVLNNIEQEIKIISDCIENTVDDPE